MHMYRAKQSIGLLIGLIVIILSPLGLAGEDLQCSFNNNEEAYHLYQLGQDARQEARYQDAIELFERSLSINSSLNQSVGVSANLN